MSQNRSKYEFIQEASLSQQLAARVPLYQKLAGSDQELSDSIAVLSYLGDRGMMNKKDLEFILGLLNVLRLSHFATSEKVNEITKMGLQMPRSDNIVTALEKE